MLNSREKNLSHRLKTTISLVMFLLFVLNGCHITFSDKSQFEELDPVLSKVDMGQYLDALEVSETMFHDYSYRRKYFGSSWEDIEKNGCSQRRDVLYRDLIKDKDFLLRSDKTCNHIVVSGNWYDPYTGYVIKLNNLREPEQAQQIQIDHIVPLSLAWRCGAKSWNDEERVVFANDLENLVAVSGSANQQKSDSGPEKWQPAANKCWYASAYIKIKAKYQLTVSMAEKEALVKLISWCK